MAGGPRVAVLGGGVTGLVAARRLGQAGARVTVFETGDQPGGQIRTVDFAGCRVDVGAEALHVAAPAVPRLLADLGLADRAVEARSGRAWIWTRRGLRRLPAGVGPAGPTRLAPVLGARVLSPAGIVRAGCEPLVPRRFAPGDDVSVGAYLAGRFGPEVRDRFVEPLLGALHAGDVDRLSLRAATPQLAALADRQRSLLLAGRSRRRAGGPGFLSFPGGLATVIEALGADPSISVRTATRARAVVADAGRYRVIADGPGTRLVGGREEQFDAVVVALPAPAARAVLRPLCPGASAGLDRLEAVSVATVLLSYPRRAAEGVPALEATGVLVPAEAGHLLKAATFLSRKWPHLDPPDSFLVRASAGRRGGAEVAGIADDDLVAALARELHAAVGLPAEPDRALVARWPGAMAQLEVGHLDRVAHIRSALADAGHGRVVLAGAPLDGIGIASCIASGEAAATRAMAQLADAAGRAEAAAR